jgi:hypothetical protein
MKLSAAAQASPLGQVLSEDARRTVRYWPEATFALTMAAMSPERVTLIDGLSGMVASS